MPRTTINLEADLLDSARQYAKHRSLTLGRAISQVLRRGFAAPAPTKDIDGILVFDLPADSLKIKSEHVRDLEANQQ